jgi:hypothetical protein
MVSPDGQLNDTEILATSDPAMNQRALDDLANWKSVRMSGDSQQPGASPQSHETFFTFMFLKDSAQ